MLSEKLAAAASEFDYENIAPFGLGKTFDTRVSNFGETFLPYDNTGGFKQKFLDMNVTSNQSIPLKELEESIDQVIRNH